MNGTARKTCLQADYDGDMNMFKVSSAIQSSRKHPRGGLGDGARI